jgi:type VI secretion system protein ImpK
VNAPGRPGRETPGAQRPDGPRNAGNLSAAREAVRQALGGGLPKAPADDRTVAAPRGKSVSGVELQRRVAGINAVLAAANVLLALVPQLRATTTHADPAGLHRELLQRLREFESNARAGGVPQNKVIAARYVLCTFLDEVIGATPWGASGQWAKHNLLQEFHDERYGGDKAFKLLERLGEDVAGNLDLLELFYVCLALGFEGRYRGQANGRAQIEAINARLVDVLRPAGERRAARTLSLRWTGVPMQRHRALVAVPLWAVFALGGVIVLGTFLVLNARLNELARPAFQQIVGVTAALRQAPDRAGPAGHARLAGPLQSDLAAGAMEVSDEALRSVITLAADPLFAAGSAELDAGRADLLGRIARALAAQPGQVLVVGHADNEPVRSLQFPSSWHLTRERAGKVAAVLVQRGVRGDRVRAEGRADVEPRGPNASPEQRARNRRIEIVLQLARPDAPPGEAPAPAGKQ